MSDQPITSGMKSHVYDYNKQLDFQNADPSKKYIWVGKLDQKLKNPSSANVNHRLGLGYSIVNDPEQNMGGPRMSEKSSRIETGDMILMEAPIELSNGILKSSENRSKKNITGVINKHKQQGYEAEFKMSRDSYEKSLQDSEDVGSVFDNG